MPSSSLDLDHDFSTLALRWDRLRAVFPELHPKRRFEAITLVSQVIGLVLSDVTDTASRGILGGAPAGHTTEETTCEEKRLEEELRLERLALKKLARR